MNRDPENRTHTVLMRGRRGSSSIVLEAEPGQAIVLIVLLVFVLLGLMALALDGGGLFLLKRQAQNAADAAALAAAYARCANGNPSAVLEAGRAAASLNKFTDAPPEVQVIINNPYNGDDNLVEALVTAEKPAFFVQLVYKGPLFVTGRAVAQCVEVFNPYEVKAIISLASCNQCNRPDPDVTVEINSSEAELIGGVASNCNCEFNSDTTSVGGIECLARSEDDLCDDYTGGGGLPIECCSTLSDEGVCTELDPAPPSVPFEDPLKNLYKIENYRPDGPIAVNAAADDCTAAVGEDPIYDNNGTCYHHLADPPNGQVNGNNYSFQGLYYIEGDFSVGGNPIVIGEKGVTFVMENGVLDLSSGSNGFIHLEPYTYDNLLAFSTKNVLDPITGAAQCIANDEVIQMGGAAPTWSGVLYAPNGGCGWDSAEGTGYGAIVCLFMRLNGARFTLIYNPLIFDFPPPEVKFLDE